MTDIRQTCNTLQLARSLLCELIDLHQAREPGRPPTLLLPIVVHLANIQKLVEASGEPSNAIKRLRDFAQMVDRRTLSDGETSEIESVRLRLVAALRLAADQLHAGENADELAGNGAVQLIATASSS